MSPVVVAMIKSIVLPPGILILLLIFFCYKFKDTSNKISYFTFSLFVLIIYLISTPFVSQQLAQLIEPKSAIDMMAAKEAKAMVVLGCNLYANAPEYSGNDDVSECTLVRLRYAAELHSELPLPLMTCGGSVLGNTQTEAEVMANVLSERFNVESKWKEDKSSNTFQNVKNAVAILNEENIDTIILVTHAIHMQRAVFSFNKYNIIVHPAPTYFFSAQSAKPIILQFMPDFNSLHISRFVAYELIGIVWHWWKHL